MNHKDENIILEKYKDYLKKGYLEAFLGMNSEKTWKPRDLHSIAEKVESHNTGWPIGVTLTKSDLAPYSIEDGIEAVISSHDMAMFDYWSLKKNGDFYFLRTFQEDEKPTLTKNGKKILWFDIQIWRISEILLYCTKLGSELELDFSRKVDMYISYNGLRDRILSCNDPMRFWFDDEWHICKTDKFEYQFSESLDYIKVNFNELIFNIASDLAYYFGRFELNRGVCNSIVDKFLSSRV